MLGGVSLPGHSTAKSSRNHPSNIREEGTIQCSGKTMQYTCPIRVFLEGDCCTPVLISGQRHGGRIIQNQPERSGRQKAAGISLMMRKKTKLARPRKSPFRLQAHTGKRLDGIYPHPNSSKVSYRLLTQPGVGNISRGKVPNEGTPGVLQLLFYRFALAFGKTVGIVEYDHLVRLCPVPFQQVVEVISVENHPGALEIGKRVPLQKVEHLVGAERIPLPVGRGIHKDKSNLGLIGSDIPNLQLLIGTNQLGCTLQQPGITEHGVADIEEPEAVAVGQHGCRLLSHQILKHGGRHGCSQPMILNLRSPGTQPGTEVKFTQRQFSMERLGIQRSVEPSDPTRTPAFIERLRNEHIQALRAGENAIGSLLPSIAQLPGHPKAPPIRARLFECQRQLLPNPQTGFSLKLRVICQSPFFQGIKKNALFALLGPRNLCSGKGHGIVVPCSSQGLIASVTFGKPIPKGNNGRRAIIRPIGSVKLSIVPSGYKTAHNAVCIWL